MQIKESNIAPFCFFKNICMNNSLKKDWAAIEIVYVSIKKLKKKSIGVTYKEAVMKIMNNLKFQITKSIPCLENKCEEW